METFRVEFVYNCKKKNKKNLFVKTMDNIFDIINAKALKRIKREEDKNVQILQHKKRRLTFIIGVDQNLKHKEEITLKCTTIEAVRK